MTVATYLISVDWNNDGDFSDANEDITADVLSTNTFTGRDYASQLTGNAGAGSLSITLDNNDGKYNSFNSSSPLYGSIVPGLPVEVKADGTAIWSGYLQSILPDVETGPFSTATLSAAGPISRLSNKKVTIALQTSIATGDAIDDVLDAAGFPAGDRDIDTGQTTMNWWLPKKGDAIPLMRDVESTEAGFIRETKDNKIAFEDRHHRLVSPHTASQATYTDASGGTLTYSSIAQEDPLQQIFNTFEATVQNFTTAGSATTLWTLPEDGANSPSIRVGVTKTFVAQYPNPDSGTNAVAVNPWTTTTATTDMTANSAADGSGTDMTADIGIVCTKTATTMEIALTNNGAVTAYITLLQARGKAVTADDPVTVFQNDATSETAYGERTWPIPGPWIPDSGTAIDYCSFELSLYKDPIPVVSVTFNANKSAAILAECIARDVSDRVTLVANNDTGLGINEDFFVESVSHTIPSSREHWTTITLSPATAFGGFWTLDLSELDSTTKLAY